MEMFNGAKNEESRVTVWENRYYKTNDRGNYTATLKVNVKIAYAEQVASVIRQTIDDGHKTIDNTILVNVCLNMVRDRYPGFMLLYGEKIRYYVADEIEARTKTKLTKRRKVTKK